MRGYISEREEKLADYFVLYDHNKEDKSYCRTSFWDRNQTKERTAYLLGKRVGYSLGVDAFKPNVLMNHILANSSSEKEKIFYKLLYLFFKRFNLGITYHPNTGMGFTKLNYPKNEKEIRTYYIGINNVIQEDTVDNIRTNIHLLAEEIPDEEIGELYRSILEIKH